MHIHPSNKTLIRLVECQNWTEFSFIVADDWLVSADVNLIIRWAPDSLSLSLIPSANMRCSCSYTQDGFNHHNQIDIVIRKLQFAAENLHFELIHVSHLQNNYYINF